MLDEGKSAADRRRKALKKFMIERGLRPADIANRCGWPSANSIYNFVNGISSSLSISSYQDIVKAIPGVTLEELTGERPKRDASPVLVKTECRGGYLRDQFSLPASQIRELPLPVTDSARQAGAFAAIVKHPGAELIYPEKSILLVLPISKFDEDLSAGRRLVIERMVGDKIEVTVREVQIDANGDCWLSQRSTEPKLSGAVKLPKTISGKYWRDKDDRYAVAGVVIGAFIPEG